MIETLLDATALPNLHPAVVHFPIALFPLALIFEAAGLLLRRNRWLTPAATTLYVFSALSAWLAVWAGEQAADSLVAVPATVQPRIGEHSDWAHNALYALAAIAVLRVVVHFWPKLTDHRGARLVLMLLGLVVLGVLGKAADLGGGLVFDHALGVRLPAAVPVLDSEVDPVEARSVPLAGSAQDRLVENENGALVWRPNAGDRDALGTVLEPAPGSDFEAVRWVETADGDGLTLDVDGTAILLFPGTFSDVQIDATVELLTFSGTFGLIHHFQDNQDRGSFSLSTEGSAVLADKRKGVLKTLDQKATELPAGPFALAVSSAGGHLKGLIDGKTVTHGHIAPGPRGACGLRLAGRGTLRLRQVSVLPLDDD